MIRVKHVAYCPHDTRYYLVLDPAEIYPDDPGNGTPAMVYFDFAGVHHASATYDCAIGAGELLSDCMTWALPSKVYEWLEGLHEYVEQFLAEDPPAPADPQDTAFIALGACAVWTTSDIAAAGRFDGRWIEFVDAAITFAPLVSDASERHSRAPFVWAYHVATPFGRWVGGALLDAGRPGGVTRAEAALALEGIIQRAYGWSGN